MSSRRKRALRSARQKGNAAQKTVLAAPSGGPEESGRIVAVPAAPPPPWRPARSSSALWAWLKMAGTIFGRISGATWASSFAYYAFFALIPMLLLLLTIGTDVAARFMGMEQAKQAAFDFIITHVPMSGTSQQTLAVTLQGVMASRGQIGVVALVVLLWSALGFFQSLVNAVNAAWENPGLNWWRLPLKNLLMVGVLLSALALGVVLPAVLHVTQHFLNWGGSWVAALFEVLTVLVPVVVLFYSFLLFYKLAPRRSTGVTFAVVWVPALVVTLLLQISQQLFTLYSTKITNFNALYGAFGGVIAVLLWTYLAGLIIVFGGCLCVAQRAMHNQQTG